MDLQRRILDASGRLLVASGYERLSMRRIAREIGISATSIYLYFANKDALFEALVDEGMDRLYQALTRAAADSPDDAEALRRMCRAYIDFGLNNPEYYEIMFMIRSESMNRFPSEKYRKARRNFDLVQRTISRVVRYETEEAEIRTASLWMSLHGIVSLIISQRIDVRIDRERVIEFALLRLNADLPSKLPAVALQDAVRGSYNHRH